MFSRIKVSTCSRMISRSHLITQTYAQNRSLHILLRAKNVTSKINHLECFSLSPVIFSKNSARFSSTNEATNVPTQPELPQIPDAPIPIQPDISGIGGETLANFGLGNYYLPTGLLQHALFFLNNTCGIPWWATIIVASAGLRLLLLPVFLKMQNHHALNDVYRKDLSYYERKRKEASDIGESSQATIYHMKMEKFYAEHGMMTIKKIVLNYGIQGLAFTSFFFSVNGMAKAQLPSMKEGGFGWFTDLTITDPYYILPLVSATCTGLFIYFSPNAMLGGGGGNFQGYVKYLKYILPAISVPIMMYLNSAVLLYIIMSTWMTLLFQGLVRYPKVRTLFKLPPLVKRDPLDQLVINPEKPESFIKSVKQTWLDIKKQRSMRAAHTQDSKLFVTAGRGPLVKTYKYDPTKVMARKQINK